jgi:hypothetical protein
VEGSDDEERERKTAHERARTSQLKLQMVIFKCKTIRISNQGFWQFF